MDSLNEKETTILNLLCQNPSISQRKLAESTDISLGLINVIIKKLNQDGYLSVTKFNNKRVEYCVTPKGQAETIMHQYKVTTSTIRNYNGILTHITTLLQELESRGFKYFSLHGDGELKELVTAMFQDGRNRSGILGSEHKNETEAVVLNLTTEDVQDFPGRVVNIVEKLSRSL